MNYDVTADRFNEDLVELFEPQSDTFEFLTQRFFINTNDDDEDGTGLLEDDDLWSSALEFSRASLSCRIGKA